jgi:hypothetical protein
MKEKEVTPVFQLKIIYMQYKHKKYLVNRKTYITFVL